MSTTAQFRGFALICDDFGTIQAVLKDNIHISEEPLVGKLLFNLVCTEERQRLLDFILEIKKKTVSRTFEFNFQYHSDVIQLNVIGTLVENRILVIASDNQYDALDFLNELQIITNEQSNTIRFLEKGQARKPAVENNEVKLLNEITLLNNELVNLQRELSRKNEELSRFNEMKNRFLGMAAHDLRNPLGVICSYTEFLIDECSDSISETHLKFLQNIYYSAGLSLSIIEDLLDISKIESGRLELKPSEFDIFKLANDNICLNRVLADRKNITINFESNEQSILMKADANKIQQVLNNLISNAIKFSFPGTSIRIKMMKESENIVFAIEDAGQGIVPEKLDKIFLPFEKGIDSGTEGEKGTGLGLAIVKRIVEGHKGKIWVESQVGRGSVFWIILPLDTIKQL